MAEYMEHRQIVKLSGVSHRPSLDNVELGVSRNFKLSGPGSDDVRSMLLLRVDAAADYYTSNKKLMENVPTVLVDIILDPYVLNVFPRSLIPTATYIFAIAIGGYFLTIVISTWLQKVAEDDEDKKNV